MEIFSVSQLAQYIKFSIDQNPDLHDIWVHGEVSNAFRSAAGHYYFTIKEGTNANIKCVLFSGNRGGEYLDIGAAIYVHGRISFYETRGDLQLYSDAVQPAGEGLQNAELERLKFQLEQEGLFDTSRKRPVPAFPHRIGIVTSEQGAVFHDICTIIARRYPLVEILLCPCAVQGEQAPTEIAQAIQAINNYEMVDVIIAGRGGGSLEDLSAFNTELVARTIYGSKIPIISAVGHETDFTIADLVADYRAPTPSAAAEAATPDVVNLAANIQTLIHAAVSSVDNSLKDAYTAIDSLARSMRGHFPDILTIRQQIDDLTVLGTGAIQNLLTQQRQITYSLQEQLDDLNPSAVLSRGYAILANQLDGNIVSSNKQIQGEDRLTATVKDGQFTVIVEREDSAPL